MPIKPNIPTGIKINKPDLAKPFDRLFTPQAKNPLEDFEPTGDLETDATNEVSEVLAGFKQRARAEQDRFELATDSEFWFAVCFQSREQKEVFLQALNWFQHGDKYLNGNLIADAIGVDLPKVKLPSPTGVNGRLIGIAADLSKH
jgi:hypothetical protein